MIFLSSAHFVVRIVTQIAYLNNMSNRTISSHELLVVSKRIIYNWVFDNEKYGKIDKEMSIMI